MRPDTLERRRDPRTQASVPVRLFMHEREDLLAAHLVDLSPGGAGLLTPRATQPEIGQYVDVIFERPDADGEYGAATTSDAVGESGAISRSSVDSTAQTAKRRPRRQTGIIVNLRDHDDDRCRIGVRFMEVGESGCELIDPIDTLSDYRSGMNITDPIRRWETARHFHVTHGVKAPLGVNKRRPAPQPV